MFDAGFNQCKMHRGVRVGGNERALTVTNCVELLIQLGSSQMKCWVRSIFASIAIVFVLSSAASGTGSFDGKIITEWISEGNHRYIKVYQSFVYIDSNGRKWYVPDGTKSDGASIPQVFWSIMGGPFEGPYRDASIVHDRYCVERTRTWQDVHNMFYDAMLTRGVSAKQAWIMYKAVEQFGPRWEPPKVDPQCIKPDGKFNYEKCTENSAIARNPTIEYPQLNKQELLRFIAEVEQQADPSDIKTLKAEAAKIP